MRTAAQHEVHIGVDYWGFVHSGLGGHHVSRAGLRNQDLTASRAFAIGGGLMSSMRGWRRPFSLADRSIAYPREPDIVTIEAAGVACFVGPAAIILVLGLITPGIRKAHQKRLYASWRDKIWDANAGWMGLALSLAATLFITSGMKAIVGKPRPNFLAICEADIDDMARFVVGGSGSEIESDAPAMVTWEICQQGDLKLLNYAFVSMPIFVSLVWWSWLPRLSKARIQAPNEFCLHGDIPKHTRLSFKQLFVRTYFC